jgi:bla regulator protein BlaR1
METTPFILALSKTLPESCLQGAVVYLVLQLLFLSYKRSTPNLKFNLYYAANLCLFIGFFYTFIHHYQQIPDASFSKPLSQPNLGNEIQTIIAKPSLWLQFSFWTSHYAYLITGLYFVGLVFCTLKLSLGLINISWFKNNKQLKSDPYLTEISVRLSSNFRLIKTVSVYLSDKICVPLTLGFIKPIIVFPIALINQLSAEQTEAILLHELAHIKRNDYLLNLLLGIVRSFLFFNPVVWLMEREINKYREQCCDDLVLDNTQHKIAYARALLLIEENRSTQLTFALPSNGKKYTLLNRIKRITQMKTNNPSPQNKFVVLLLILVTISVSVAWNMPLKKALKSYTLRHSKIEAKKIDGSKSETIANKIVMTKASKQDTIRFFSDKIVFQPSSISNRKLTISGKRIEFNPSADTVIKSKNKFKIVLEDSTGNKKEYNSIEELPADAQKEFLKQNGKLDQLQGFNSSDVKMDTSEIASIKKQFNSPEWKKQMADIRKQGEEIRKQFNSPEWKKQMADIRKQGEEIRKQFNSPKWKKEMLDIQRQSAQIKKQFNSPEWKKQMEDLRKNATDSARANWKKSSDEQRKLVPEKAGEPKKL